MSLVCSIDVTCVFNRCHVCVFQILVLLDVTPDQSMLDEGLAREVVNRIQRLRKKVVSLSYCSLVSHSVTFFTLMTHASKFWYHTLSCSLSLGQLWAFYTLLLGKLFSQTPPRNLWESSMQLCSSYCGKTTRTQISINAYNQVLVQLCVLEQSGLNEHAQDVKCQHSIKTWVLLIENLMLQHHVSVLQHCVTMLQFCVTMLVFTYTLTPSSASILSSNTADTCNFVDTPSCRCIELRVLLHVSIKFV